MNKTFTLSIFLVLAAFAATAQAPRTVLLELSESVWTPGNAQAICLKEQLRSSYGDDIAIISYHPDDFQNMGQGDPLYNNVSNQWFDAFNVSAFGVGSMDRISYNNGTNLLLSKGLWIDSVASRINQTSVGLVTTPEVLVDPNEDELFVRVQINFEKDVIELKDYRMYLYLVEDGKVAKQVVDTDAVVGCSFFNDTIDTVESFSHNDVAIRSVSGYDGTDDVIPNEVLKNSQYTYSYSFPVPSGSSVDNLRVVAFVSDYNLADLTKNKVINAAQSSDFTEYDSTDPDDPNHPENPDNPNSAFNPDNWPTGVEELVRLEETVVYPNPMTDLGIVEFTVPSRQNVAVDVYEIDGRFVKRIYRQDLAAGKQKAAMNVNSLASGIYLVKISGSTFETQARILVQ